MAVNAYCKEPHRYHGRDPKATLYGTARKVRRKLSHHGRLWGGRRKHLIWLREALYSTHYPNRNSASRASINSRITFTTLWLISWASTGRSRIQRRRRSRTTVDPRPVASRENDL